MARLAERKEQALHAGSEEAVQRQHDRGKMTARERIDHVLDEGRSRSSTCWPAGPSEAVEIVHRRELAEAAGPAARRAEFIEAYTERHANPYEAAERGSVDDVIDPADNPPGAGALARLFAHQARGVPQAQARQHAAVNQRSDGDGEPATLAAVEAPRPQAATPDGP